MTIDTLAPMALNREVPGFDLAMELLCTLPVEPYYAHLATLNYDLGIAKQTETTALLKTLNDRYKFVPPLVTFCGGLGQGRLAWIPKGIAARAREIGQAYWAKVYGDE